MGLLNDINNINTYINIESFDINLKKKRVRVRTRLFNNFGDDKPYNTDEIIIDFDAFKKCCENEAVKGVDIKKLRKEINKLSIDKIPLVIEVSGTHGKPLKINLKSFHHPHILNDH